jgi:hypothetical protein
MIPEFSEQGYLPPGIHRATLAEIEERSGRGTEIRRAQMQSLYWLVDLARRAGIERLILNGSFVTDAFEPNDVDCVLLMGLDFPRERAAASEFPRACHLCTCSSSGRGDSIFSSTRSSPQTTGPIQRA